MEENVDLQRCACPRQGEIGLNNQQQNTELERRMYADCSVSSNISIKNTACLGEAECHPHHSVQLQHAPTSLGQSASGQHSAFSGGGTEPQYDQYTPSDMAHESRSQGFPTTHSSLPQEPDQVQLYQRLPPSGVSSLNRPHSSSFERDRANPMLQAIMRAGEVQEAEQTSLKMTNWTGQPSHRVDFGSQSIAMDSTKCHEYNYDISTQPKTPFLDLQEESNLSKGITCQLLGPGEDAQNVIAECNCFKSTHKVKDIPQDGLDGLAMYLEPEIRGGKNWRHLASKKKMENAQIEHLKRDHSPFKEMLRLPEFNMYTIEMFKNDLKLFQRLDALDFLEKYLRQIEQSCTCI